jgi:hypothetical protein
VLLTVWFSSIVLASAGFLFLVAFEGFGHINLTVEQSATAFWDISLHPAFAAGSHERPALFCLLSAALSGMAWVGLIPLGNLFMCVLYSLLFGFISGKALMAWAFPLSLAADDGSFTHSIFSYPFLYMFASKFLFTLVAVWNPQLAARSAAAKAPASTSSSGIAQAALVFACATPFFGLLWAMSANLYPQTHSGIEWSAIVGFSSLCCTTRARELYLEWKLNLIQNGGARGKSRAAPSMSVFQGVVGGEKKGSTGDTSVTVPCAVLAVFWTSFAVLTSKNLDHDVYIPLSMCTLLCTPPNTVIKNTSPLKLFGVLCALFWVISSLYATLLKGYGSDPTEVLFQNPHDFFGMDSNVSIWLNESSWMPLFNTMLVVLPLPAIYIGGTERRSGFTEDVMFVLAIVSIVPVFAAQINCLRYLGVTGLLFAAWRGYNISSLQHRSDLLI